MRNILWAMLVGVLVGLGLGYLLYRSAPAPIETEAPAIVLPGGGQVLHRDPNANLAPPPAGAPGKVVRKMEVKVQTALPDPVTVNLSLLEQKDHTFRIAAFSPDGKVIEGTDQPVEALFTGRPPKDLPWRVGASYGLSSRSYGVFVQRDLGPLSVGLELSQYPAGQWRAYEVRTTLAIRF